MMKLQYLQNKEFRITWKAIDIGFKGETVFSNQLSTRDIIEYALLRMENGDDDETLVELACEYDTNAEEVERLVKLLASKENTKYDIEFRKWRVLYVAKKMPSNEAEYINGLMELGDIWVEFDFPEDSPHIFQGRKNDITPQQYYTKENYAKLLQKHRNWIEKEINQLKDM